MPTEWTKELVVQPGGRIELVLPDLGDGERVRVVVRREFPVDSSQNGRRRAGNFAGEIHMSDDFDAPLDDFREYA